MISEKSPTGADFQQIASLLKIFPVLARRLPGGLPEGSVVAADAGATDDRADFLNALGGQLQQRLADGHAGTCPKLGEGLVKKLLDQARQVRREITMS